MRKRVVINRGDNDVRVAFLEDGNLVEFHIENLLDRTIVGNIYRGVVQDVIPGLQAAFIDVGMDRNLFLHFMDIRPESLVFLEDDFDAAMSDASKETLPGRIQLRGRRPRPDPRAKDAPPPVKKGDTIVVQVVKDEISAKAPRATANMTLAGRYLVLLPFPSQQGGVSRRVALGQERMKLKKLLADLRTDQYSFIVRTAGLGVEEDQIRSDVELLTSEWKGLVDRFRSMKGPGLVYSDHDIVNRLVRDAFKADIDEVVVDDEEMAEALRSTLARSLPELVEKVVDYDGREPVFTSYQVDAQLEKALNRKVWLKSGGYLIIDEAEALTAIDVNSGRFTGSKDQEKTSLRTNMEACEAIGQQIRLRDIGGIIVIDFIDMLSRDHQQKVADELKHQMRHDRAKYTIGRLGDFGLMMMTRKRKHQSLQKQVFDSCPYCKGEGRVLCPDEVWRRIRRDLNVLSHDQNRLSGILLCTSPTVMTQLQGEFAPFLEAYTQRSGLEIILQSDSGLHVEDYTITPVRRPERQAPHLPAVRIVEDDIMRTTIPYDKRPGTIDLRSPVVSPTATPRSTTAPASRRPAAPAVSSPIPAAPNGEAAAQDDEGAQRRTRRGRRGGRRRRGTDTPAEGILETSMEALGLTELPEGGLETEEIDLEDDVLREAVSYALDGEEAAPAARKALPPEEEAAAKVEEAARVPDGERRRSHQQVRFDRRRSDGEIVNISSMPTPVAESDRAPAAPAAASAASPLLSTGKVHIVNNWGTAQASPVVKKARKKSPFLVAGTTAPAKPYAPSARKITVLGTWGVSPHPATVLDVGSQEPIGPSDPAHISAERHAPAAAAPEGKRSSRHSRPARKPAGAAKADAAKPQAKPAAAPAPAKVEAPKPAAAKPAAPARRGMKKAAASRAAAPTKPQQPAAKAATPAKPAAAQPKAQPAPKQAAKQATNKAGAKKVVPKAAATKPASKAAAPKAAAKPAPPKAAAPKPTVPKKGAAKKATKKAAKKSSK